jgi:hypothetical protein
MVAFMRQCNTVDVTRRSPSYEMRLTKYASRGFEVYAPSLRRADIDPTVCYTFTSFRHPRTTVHHCALLKSKLRLKLKLKRHLPQIYERSITRISGLARLLVLEKLADPETRVGYLDHRRSLRGRPTVDRPWQRRGNQFKGDLKADAAVNGLQINDYDVLSLHM